METLTLLQLLEERANGYAEAEQRKSEQVVLDIIANIKQHERTTPGMNNWITSVIQEAISELETVGDDFELQLGYKGAISLLEVAKSNLQ